MNRLKNNMEVIYDSNLIIYYCFSTKKHKIIELTNKTQKLTEFLIKQNSNITIPEFLINELRKEKLTKIVSNYISSRREVTNLPKNQTYLFKLELENLIPFLKKNWINIEQYQPKDEIKDIENFFLKLSQNDKKKFS